MTRKSGASIYRPSCGKSTVSGIVILAISRSIRVTGGFVAWAMKPSMLPLLRRAGDGGFVELDVETILDGIELGALVGLQARGMSIEIVNIEYRRAIGGCAAADAQGLFEVVAAVVLGVE